MVMTAHSWLSNAQSVRNESGASSGFQVNYRLVKESPQFELIKAAMDRQIMMVTEVDLPRPILMFFKRVPITIEPGKPSYAGQYLGKTDKHVDISENFLLCGRKPALLHELLHAYHDQKLPQGFHNRQIKEFFEKAQELGVYNPQSHMMANQKEYFASAGTAYLFGVTALEPFTREKIQKNQPVFYRYLQNLFGPETGKYKGDLKERVEIFKDAKTEEPPSEKNGE
jgi:hypothetical protein